MNHKYIGALLAALMMPLSGLAGDTVAWPALQEGEWAIHGTLVAKNGNTSETPAWVAACTRPTRTMQQAIDRFKERGCKIEASARADGVVGYGATCATADGNDVMTVTLSAPHERRYRHVLVTALGTSTMDGHWLGPCKPGSDEPRVR